jgi:hypothetical protein
MYDRDGIQVVLPDANVISGLGLSLGFRECDFQAETPDGAGAVIGQQFDVVGWMAFRMEFMPRPAVLEELRCLCV